MGLQQSQRRGDRGFVMGRQRQALAAALTLGTLPMMLGWPWFFEGGAPKSIFLQSLGSGALVAGVAFVPALARLFSTRICVYLGRISYSLYLLHFPVVLLLVSLARRLKPRV